MKRTKIICSIGPVSRNYDTMKSMIQNGMNVARINFSHADEIEKRETIDLVRQLNKDLGSYVGILFDTKGPDFRTGVVENDGINLIDGNSIKIVKEDVIGNEERITINYKDAIDAIAVDNIILLEDGLMKLLVTDKDAEGLTCKIITGGFLGSRKGINVPGVKLNMPFISEQDKEDIKYACENDGDFLALSFVSSKEDILEARKIMAEYGNTTMKIISKIESDTAIKNIDEIIENSDGIMVARGDLGVEVPMQQLPVLQKMIVKKCREKGKFCIVATEMLASMYKNPRPTRAEVTDIANAVLDGTDAVMLSGETTVGKFPVDAVKYMADICENTELYLDYENGCEDCQKKDITGTIARSVIDTANILDIKVIVAATMSGYTARRISNLRPKSYIIAGCPTEKVALSLSLNWGIFPKIVPVYNTTDEVVEDSTKKAKEFANLKEGDLVVITGGFPNNAPNKSTNFLKIQEI
ncbi:MAG TPA: pyruvate kinase [Tenericutes bacterium]|nr:pyruvate kinase [Mycoplasmatota bacterium]